MLQNISRRITSFLNTPFGKFLSDDYLRHNQRRLEHLASLRLPLCNCTVLEIGAGIGDHTSFFLDRNCTVTSTDARKNNVKIIRSRFRNAKLRVHLLNLEDQKQPKETYDVVYSYGLLYHLGNPEKAIEHMASWSGGLLLLETCVSPEAGSAINRCSESIKDPTQSYSGIGCRPTREFIFDQLKKYFPFVYMPLSQPYHEQFPIDWTTAVSDNKHKRAIFVASREKISNDMLTEEIPMKQIRV